MELKLRKQYLDQLIAFKDTELIKVVTGIRRCGKSSLLKLMMAHLRENSIPETQIIHMNFESMKFADMDSKAVYEYVAEKVVEGKRLYIFLDEVQKVAGWQNAVNAFRVDLDCDIYVTGSNAFLLSSELSTYLSGRYIEIKMLPLSFKEFLDFHGYTMSYQHTPYGVSANICGRNGEGYHINSVFETYARFGGMPSLADIGLDQEKANVLLDGIYSAVVVRDILERGRRKEQRAITDAHLLRKIILFLADNIGNNTSSTSIGRTLVAEGLLDEGPRKTSPAPQTISAYIDALLESYIFYEVKRFDIKGKDYLRTLGKYYIVDTGLRNYLLGNRGGDTGHILENIIYFELLRRGYEVAIGKIGEKEIDFIATKTNEKKYIQVTESMLSPETRERELAPLRAIRDNYEKIVIAMDHGLETDIDGIKIINAIDFLLSE